MISTKSQINNAEKISATINPIQLNCPPTNSNLVRSSVIKERRVVNAKIVVANAKRFY